MEKMIDITLDDGVCTVSLMRPRQHNALNRSMWIHLRDIFQELSGKTNLRCVILQGGGVSFCSGADIFEFPEFRSGETVQGYDQVMCATFDALLAISCPVIAAIHGYCLGGGLELALACDIRFASADASFGIPIGKLGHALYEQQIVHLTRVVGQGMAREMLLLGTIIDAEKALHCGLVTRLYDNSTTLHMACQKAARGVARDAPSSVRWHKQALEEIAAHTRLSAVTRRAGQALSQSEDYRSGIAAALQKQSAKFIGS